MDEKKELDWKYRLYQMTNGFMMTVGDYDVKDTECYVFDTDCEESKSQFDNYFTRMICNMMNELDIENAKISIKVEPIESL